MSFSIICSVQTNANLLFLARGMDISFTKLRIEVSRSALLIRVLLDAEQTWHTLYWLERCPSFLEVAANYNTSRKCIYTGVYINHAKWKEE